MPKTAVTIRLEDDDLAIVDKLSGFFEHNRSQAIRFLIRQASDDIFQVYPERIRDQLAAMLDTGA